jgi:RNA polymerase sigma factor (sigma-70 family)
MPLPLSGPGASRGLTLTGFSRLLERLHSDRDQAAEAYERMHRTLVRFFDWRGIGRAEECADTTIDRLARRLEEDVEVQDVRHYAIGIARFVALEALRAPMQSSLDEAREIPLTPAETTDEAMDRGFDRCLEELPGESRTILLRYYEGEHGQRKVIRRQLARSLQISENALRSRVQRLRDRLEQCMATQARAGKGEA